jgi:hypothetical protein
MDQVRRSVVVAIAAALLAMPASAQQRRPPARKTPSKPAAQAPPKTTTPETRCPSLLGMGVKTIRSFCDVPAGKDPKDGIVVSLPPHTGTVTLSFDLHARHTYSEEQTKSGKGFAQYQAVISIVTAKGDVISRAAIQTEFRSANDLFDRIGGGAGGGPKAVAPAGHEQIYVTIPAGVDEVSLLGDSLDAMTPAGHETVVMPGRPVAIVSNLLIEYRPKR